MANVTITGSISYSAAKYGLTIPLEAGETLIAGYACYIKSDGKAWLAGTAIATGTTQVKFDGFVVRDYASGDAVTLIGQGSVLLIDGNAGFNEGDDLWLGATAGVLSDAKVAGQDQPVARAVSTSAIRVVR
jgi:hypothetical protein